MKTNTLVRGAIIGAACMSLLGATARAGDNRSEPRFRATHSPQPVILVEVTGSRIPQRVVRYGQQVNSASPLYVIQGDELNRGGATTVSGILSQDPSITFVRGR